MKKNKDYKQKMHALENKLICGKAMHNNSMLMKIKKMKQKNKL